MFWKRRKQALRDRATDDKIAKGEMLGAEMVRRAREIQAQLEKMAKQTEVVTSD